MRKAYTVIIHDKEYDVWDIEGKEMDCGNGEPLTYWVYMADRLPDGLTPPIDSDNWVHYHVSIQRHLWDIKFTQKNTTKEKWGSTQFRNNTHVEMWCNKKLIYEFGTTGTQSGLSFAMAKVQYLQTMLSEHCYNFFEPKENEGRKIFWKGLPATVKVKSYGWEIAIIPDYTAGLNKEQWWAELSKREKNLGEEKYDDMKDVEEEDFKESMQSDYINWGDALSDQHINWFRK